MERYEGTWLPRYYHIPEGDISRFFAIVPRASLLRGAQRRGNLVTHWQNVARLPRRFAPRNGGFSA